MFLRTMPDKTLSDVANELNTTTLGWGGSTLEIKPHLNVADPFFELENASGPNHEIPFTMEGLEQLAGFAKLPTKFVERVHQGIQAEGTREESKSLLQQMVTWGLQSNVDNVSVSYVPNGGITEVYHANQLRIEPRRLVERIMNVMDPSSQVIEVINTPDHFRLDTVVHEGAHFGWGGETDKEEGDISAGGIRVDLNRAGSQAHAPSVGALLFRLECTNGYESLREQDKIELRGSTIDSLFAEFEGVCEQVFSRVEAELASFYEMKNRPVEGDLTQAVMRVAEERGLSPRMAHTLATRVPRIAGENGEATWFDVINLITNEANEPSVRRSATRSRALELAGGRMIGEHTERCSHCQQKLN